MAVEERADPGGSRPIPSGGVLRGRVTPPPSKSITHRALNLTLLSGRRAVIERPLFAEDTRLFLAALDVLGWSVERGARSVRLAPPAAPAHAPSGRAELFCGNAGTMFRLLAASLAAIPGTYRLDGTARLRQRPVGPLLAALRALGARIECPEKEGHAPLEIAGASLRGGAATLEAGESSQYLSALLMAGLAAPGPITLDVPALTSAPYVELTRAVIRGMVPGPDPVERVGEMRYEVVPSRSLRAVGSEVRRFRVEGDLSAACYPAAGAALTGGAVEILGVHRDSAQGDRGLFDLLERMGAFVAWGEDRVTVRGGARLVSPGVVDLSTMPDQVPTLAALAPFAEGVTRIENVAHLRLKESDRLQAMAEGLARTGAEVEQLEDGLVIPGRWAGDRVVGGSGEEIPIDPFDDHRIAMAFALVGLRRCGVVVNHSAVVAKSYPAFWDDLAALLDS